jgi:diguanylate cyclase (GGDEF)-like protein/PAS domain S-box-containing protein
MEQDLGPRAAVLYGDLRKRIASGELVIGARLPAQSELATEYGMAIMTVRQAIARLEREGLVTSVQGRSTFVQSSLLAAQTRIEQEKLKLREEWYHSLVEFCPVGFMVVSEGMVRYVNRATLAMLGASDPRELIGRHVYDFVHPAFTEQLTARTHLIELHAGVTQEPVKVQLIRLDGTIIDVETRSMGITYEDRGAAAILLFDLTPRVQAQEQSARLAAIVASSRDAIHSSTLDGRICTWNAGAEALYGYAADEVIGRSLTLLAAPGHVSEFLVVLERLARGESIEEYQTIGVHKNGQKIPMSLSVSPIADAQGVVIGASSIARDMRSHLAANKALREREERYRSVVEASIDGLVMNDLAGTIIFANLQMARMLGYESPDQLIGRQNMDIVAPDSREQVPEKMQAVVREGAARGIQLRLLRRDGSSFPAEIDAVLMRDESGEPFAMTAALRDVTERYAYEEELRSRALYDSLTGLPNRALLLDRLAYQIRLAKRQREPFAFLLLDLDRFKDVNDSLGHQFGDILLCEVAERLGQTLRASDTVARLGGDEFAVVLPGADAVYAAQVADKIQAAVREPVLLQNRTVYCGLSIGIVVHPDFGDDASALLSRADVAMYSAKSRGEDYAVYDSELDQQNSNRLALSYELRQAIESDQLTVYYQPIVNLKTGCADHVEALVRWIHPERGLLPPSEFVGLAEQTGLIEPLTLWVLREALRRVKAWRDGGLDLDVSVNLSAWCFQDPHLVEAIAEQLLTLDVSAACLTLEITESTFMMDPDRAMCTLTSLHEMGVRITIDDFGKGYSSLSYLTHLPIDGIKIDRSFVLTMSRDVRESTVVVRSVIDLGHNLGLQVVAEGVESAVHLQALAGMGCDMAQGYYMSRPLPADHIPSWMENWRNTSWLQAS